MKKIKVLALAMALVMLALCAVACTSEKVRVNVKVSVVVDGETYLDGYAYTVENKAETPPTVLQAVSEVFQMVEYAYIIDDAGLSFESITVDGTEYKAGMSADGSYIGYWGYTVDGAEPEEGRAGNTPAKEGSSIVFTFGTTPMNEQEFSSGEE